MDEETFLMTIMFLVIISLLIMAGFFVYKTYETRNEILDMRVWSLVTDRCMSACHATDRLYIPKSMYEDFRTCECLEKECVLDRGHNIQGFSYSFTEESLQVCSIIIYKENRI